MELTVEHLNKVYTKHGNQNHVYKDYPGLVTSWSNYACLIHPVGFWSCLVWHTV